MKNTDLNKKLFYRQLFTVAFPVTIQSLMLALVATADTLMLGSLDQNSMSAVSMATQVQFIQNMVISSSVFAFSILGQCEYALWYLHCFLQGVVSVVVS